MTKVFVASNMPTDYPNKLQKPSTVGSRVRDTADVYILDSGIGDDVSNAEVLELAEQHDADYVIGKDYLHDQEATTESVKEFLELHALRDVEATPMIPLQPPYHEHYHDLPGYSHYVLGGMVDDEISTRQRIRWIEKFDAVSHDCYTHGLGIGGGQGIVQAFAGAGILDSVDCSTPEQAAMFGSVLTDGLRQKEVLAHSGGDGKSNRTYPLAEFNSWQVHDAWANEAAARKQRDRRAWA